MKESIMSIAVTNSPTSDTLVIAFTGFNHKLNVSVDDFFEASGLGDMSRIVVSDQTRRLSLGGIQPALKSFQELLLHLNDLVREITPEKLIITGTSGGAYSAILFGHLLRAQQVICFSPYSNLNRDDLTKLDDPAVESMKRILERLEALPKDVHKYFDLASVLSSWNGTTDYFVHVSKYHKWDYKRALLLEKSPHVSVVAHPYDKHSLVFPLIRNSRLPQCFSLPHKRYTTIYHDLKAGVVHSSKRVMGKLRTS